MNLNNTTNFEAINKKTPFIGCKEFILPNTQRDNINIFSKKLEPHSQCKSTSCTIFLNWLGGKLKKEYPKLATLEFMNDFQYNNILLSFMGSGEKIQDWNPHIKLFRFIFKEAKLPYKVNFGNTMKNMDKILKSMLLGFPVVQGLKNTNAGHIILWYRNYNYLDYSNCIIDSYGNPLNNYRNQKADYYMIDSNNWNKWLISECNSIFISE